MRGFQTLKKIFFDMHTLLYLFITCFWLRQVLVAACGLSLVVASGRLTAVAPLAVEPQLSAPGLQ